MIEWTTLWLQVANKNEGFLLREAALNLRDSTRRSDILEGACSGVAAPGSDQDASRTFFSSEVVRAPPAKLRPRGWPRTRLRDYISQSARGTRGPSVMMVEEEAWSTLLPLKSDLGLENGWMQDPTDIWDCIHQGKPK